MLLFIFIYLLLLKLHPADVSIMSKADVLCVCMRYGWQLGGLYIEGKGNIYII